MSGPAWVGAEAIVLGLVSERSRSPRRVDAPGGIRVIDTIDMKESYGVAHAPGVVAVLDSYRPADPQGFIGRVVQIRPPSGRSFAARVEGVRDHAETISFFFKGLTVGEIPVGSSVEFDG